MQTEELAAQDLLEEVRHSDRSIDALLALLAYAYHGDNDLLMEAREQGAEVGSVGQSAHALRTRLQGTLQ
jgi:hypothetical protein